jgi:hypothetical protein
MVCTVNGCYRQWVVYTMGCIDNGLHSQWLFLIATFNMWNYLTCMSIYLGKKTPRNLIEQNTVWLKYKWNNEEMDVNCWSKNWIPFQGTWVNPSFFSGVRITRSLVFCVCFVDRCLYFWYFPFDLPRFTNFDYPFDIFKLFMKKIWPKLAVKTMNL